MLIFRLRHQDKMEVAQIIFGGRVGGEENSRC
jgi:hypothetical protein